MYHIFASYFAPEMLPYLFWKKTQHKEMAVSLKWESAKIKHILQSALALASAVTLSASKMPGSISSPKG